MTNPTVPNVVIKNPAVRRYARTGLDYLGFILGVIVVADLSSDGFDFTAVTTPFIAAWTFARTVFGAAVDNPNTPKQ